jgi:transcriptional regulator with XRE-family HTH domain
MRIGEKIRMIREIKGISQDAIATNLNMTAQAFGKIEREETKLDFKRIEEIAKYLQVKVEDIINFDEKNIFNNSFYDHSKGVFNSVDSKDSIKIIDKLLSTIDVRFQKYDELLLSNMKVIEKFGELIKK